MFVKRQIAKFVHGAKEKYCHQLFDSHIPMVVLYGIKFLLIEDILWPFLNEKV